ncbi:RnfABCDGE type electron transport complex subunit G [Vibrio sp. WXL103]|uniref:RnfABCDGE type electron transport complex subunit G n=1 Tax=Vibrio sp. WXL103 TaxID=3450710 RepID=UPI003EC7ECC6
MSALIERWKERIAYQSLLLGSCCGLAASLLFICYHYTQPVIAQRILDDQQALLTEVLAGADVANRVFDRSQSVVFNDQVYLVYSVKNALGKTSHHVIKAQQKGYSGPISFLLGVDATATITGVRVISHSETPGLGDKIELAKSDWILDFNGRSLTNTPAWAVKKDGGQFDQFTGATITARSMVQGVHNALQAFESHNSTENQEAINE